ncbi:MAG TPA: hypothetical protein VNJ51_09345 [Candidatus Dormibacteraeota bacterium]|nr:hypothetical protein [Candidatus Dormibacteraeota bacterium]
MDDISTWRLRDPDAVWLYVWIVGAYGGHDFLLGRSIAWLKLIFCWTAIPAIVAIVQLFTIRTWIRNKNARYAEMHGLSSEMVAAFANWFPADHLMRSMVPSSPGALTPPSGT